MKTFFNGLILAATLLLLNGCVGAAIVGGLAAGAAVGAGAIAYTKGELRVVEAISLDQAWTAAQKGLQALELTAIDKGKDRLNAKLSARTSEGKEITLNLKNEGARLTEVRIRIGTFGDEQLSRRILEAMRKHYRD